jgi:hypothetical protein
VVVDALRVEWGGEDQQERGEAGGRMAQRSIPVEGGSEW